MPTIHENLTTLYGLIRSAPLRNIKLGKAISETAQGTAMDLAGWAMQDATLAAQGLRLEAGPQGISLEPAGLVDAVFGSNAADVLFCGVGSQVDERLAESELARYRPETAKECALHRIRVQLEKYPKPKRRGKGERIPNPNNVKPFKGLPFAPSLYKPYYMQPRQKKLLIRKPHLAALKQALKGFDTAARRSTYKKSVAYRWDVLYASQEGTPSFDAMLLYRYLNEHDIYAALCRLIPPLENDDELHREAEKECGAGLASVDAGQA